MLDRHGLGSDKEHYVTYDPPRRSRGWPRRHAGAARRIVDYIDVDRTPLRAACGALARVDTAAPRSVPLNAPMARPGVRTHCVVDNPERDLDRPRAAGSENRPPSAGRRRAARRLQPAPDSFWPERQRPDDYAERRERLLDSVRDHRRSRDRAALADAFRAERRERRRLLEYGRPRSLEGSADIGLK